MVKLIINDKTITYNNKILEISQLLKDMSAQNNVVPLLNCDDEVF